MRVTEAARPSISPSTGPETRAARHGAPITENGKRVWVWFDDIETREDLFEELGRDFEREQPVALGRVGSAEARLFSQRAAVDFAVDWLRDRGR